MKELTKVFNDVVLPIEVIDKSTFMVNVSGIAKAHGKNITDWKNSKGLKEYLSALEKANAYKGLMVDTSIVGKTMIHSKILVHFARFISAEFAVWCDNTIYDILTKAKDDEIKALKEARRMALITPDGFGSVRAIAQRTEYSEKQIRSFLESVGAIKRTVKDTLYWSKGDTEINGLVRQDGEFGTPYMNFNRTVSLLVQEYNTEDE